MKFFKDILFCTLVASSFVATHLLNGQNQTSMPLNQCVDEQEKIYSTFENNKNAIVKVFAQKEISITNKDGQELKNTSLDVGSGFLISKDGLVMTSAYVTYKASKIWVEWCGILLDAHIVGFDPLTTLAIIKIDGDFKSRNAPIITLDTSAILPKPATLLMGISYELGLPPSPRIGLATAHNIEFGGQFLPTVYVRTTIPAPRGSTGGAVFDFNGKCVGMTIASLPEIGSSFILPAKAAARIRDDILLGGEPVYSWFGITAKDSDGFESTKVIVTMVAENAPAKKAGFEEGDEIVEINSQKVINNTQLRNSTFFIRPNETATFKVRRNNNIFKIDVLAKQMPPEIIHAAEANLASPWQALSQSMQMQHQKHIQNDSKK